MGNTKSSERQREKNKMIWLDKVTHSKVKLLSALNNDNTFNETIKHLVEKELDNTLNTNS